MIAVKGHTIVCSNLEKARGGVFVTVGAQTPFDRLVRTVDEWAASERRSDVFAQIGQSRWCPQHIEWTKFLSLKDFRRRVRQCRAMVAHAGTGSIIAAMEFARPIIVLPRRAALGETRNDHQLATVRRFAERGVVIAMNEAELVSHLSHLDRLPPPDDISRHGSDPLIATIREFIASNACDCMRFKCADETATSF